MYNFNSFNEQSWLYLESKKGSCNETLAESRDLSVKFRSSYESALTFSWALLDKCRVNSF